MIKILHFLLLISAVTPDFNVQEHSDLAASLFQNHEFEKSAKIYRQLISKTQDENNNTQNLQFYKLQVSAWFNTENMDEFIETTQSALELFPTEPIFYNFLCRKMIELKLQVADYNIVQFTKECEKASQLDATNTDYQITLADFYSASNQLEKAIESYKKLYSNEILRADDTLATNFADVLIRTGNYLPAWDIMQELIKSNSPIELFSASWLRSLMQPFDKLAWELNELAISEFVKTVKINDPRICNASSWKIYTNWSIAAKENPDILQVTTLNPNSAYSAYSNTKGVVFVGPELERYPTKFHEKYIYLVRFHSAFITSMSAIIHANCTIFTNKLFELHQFIPTNEIGYEISIDVPVVSIVQQKTKNYYHFVLESVPRLIYLDNLVLQTPGGEHTKILVAEHEMKYLQELWSFNAFIGLKERIITFPKSSYGLRLFFPYGISIVDWMQPDIDTFGSWDHNLWGLNSPPKEIILAARKFLLEAAESSSPDHQKTFGDVIFVSRAGKSRDILNEKEVIEVLRNSFGERLVVHTGKEGMLEQIEMFSHAKVVVGGHGAGLVNFLFTPEHAGLITLTLKPHVEFCFGHLSAALGRRHWIITVLEGSFYSGNYGKISPEETKKIVESINEALEYYSNHQHNEL